MKLLDNSSPNNHCAPEPRYFGHPRVGKVIEYIFGSYIYCLFLPTLPESYQICTITDQKYRPPSQQITSFLKKGFRGKMPTLVTTISPEGIIDAISMRRQIQYALKCWAVVIGHFGL
jgi:hypothetical protein